MDEVIHNKRQHPEEPYWKVAKRFHVATTTLHDRVTSTHEPRGVRQPRNLSIIQEEVLIAKIEAYAERGTLLTPWHITELAIALCGRTMGMNWTSTFLRRYRNQLSSRFHKVQELAKLRADTEENRQAWFKLVKGVYDTGLYTSVNIYNMDETGFELNDTRTLRTVPPPNAPSRSQSSLAAVVHISIVAAIPNTDAPDWFRDIPQANPQIAAVSKTGYITSHLALQWLTDIFDPHTWQRSQGQRRLLLLDGHKTHIQVNLLEACWDRNISVIILPTHLTPKLQPLDVGFFKTLQSGYAKQVINYQLGSDAASFSKGFFYHWHLRAWLETANTRITRSAWRRAGLYPLSAVLMRAETPPSIPNIQDRNPITPQSVRSLQKIDRGVRRGEVEGKMAFEKTQKALQKVFAEMQLLRRDVEKRDEASKLDKAARAGGNRGSYPKRTLFDPEYKEKHRQELATRKEAEAEKSAEKAAKKKAVGKGKLRAQGERPVIVFDPLSP